MEAIQVDNWWIHKDEWEFMKAWRKEQEIKLGEFLRCSDEERKILTDKWNKEREEKETFYFVNLKHNTTSESTTGMKSRKTGKIYLCKEGYEIDLTQPIENTEFHYVRDSRPMDI